MSLSLLYSFFLASIYCKIIDTSDNIVANTPTVHIKVIIVNNVSNSVIPLVPINVIANNKLSYLFIFLIYYLLAIAQ